MKKICKFCGQEFEARIKTMVVCKNPACQQQRRKEYYLSDVKECTCKTCGNTYKATRKQSHDFCPECVNKPYNFKTTYEQNHCCRQCGEIVFVETKNLTRGICKNLYDVTCEQCKIQNAKNSSIRMTLDNPSFNNIKYNSLDEAYAAKQQKLEAKHKYKSKNEMLLAFSIRMKKNNPMKNPDTAEKVAKTLKEKYAVGEIISDGTKRSNYKGDRGIKQYIRIALKFWIKENLERTNYTCENCGQHGGYLMVHHTEKFSDIVERFASQLNIDLKTLEYKSEDYNKLEQLVIEYHINNNIGIVLCEQCHDKIDKCFHKRKIKEVIDIENS